MIGSHAFKKALVHSFIVLFSTSLAIHSSVSAVTFISTFALGKFAQPFNKITISQRALRYFIIRYFQTFIFLYIFPITPYPKIKNGDQGQDNYDY